MKIVTFFKQCFAKLKRSCTHTKLPDLGSLWMLVAALGFAIMGALVKVGSAKFSSAELVFYRSAFGLLAIYVFIFAKKLPLKTPVIAKHMSRSIIGFASLVLFFYAIAHLPLATAITLNYTSPLFLTLLMPYMLQKEHHQQAVKKWLYGAVILGFIGVTLLLQPTLQAGDALAGALGLASGLGAAIAYIHIKQLSNVFEPDWRTVFYFTLVSTIGSGAWLLLQNFTAVLWQDLPLLIGLGFSATIAQMALTRAYRTGRTLVVASLAYVTVVLASLFGVFFWQEQLTSAEWLAIGLIILSGIISIIATNTNVEK